MSARVRSRNDGNCHFRVLRGLTRQAKLISRRGSADLLKHWVPGSLIASMVGSGLAPTLGQTQTQWPMKATQVPSDPSSSGSPRIIDRTALALLLLSCAVLLVSLNVTRSRLVASVASVDTLQIEVEFLRSERIGFISVLANRHLDPPFLAGTDPRSGNRVSFDIPTDGIYYTIRPDCRACTVNYPLLNAISARSHLPVFGLALAGGDSAMSAYARGYHLRFPVLVHPTGSLLGVIPTHGTPVTMLLRGGQISAVYSGRLPDSLLILGSSALAAPRIQGDAGRVPQ